MAPLCRMEESILIVVDIQERLLSAIAEQARERMLRCARQLLQAADLLDIPVIYTEQYPDGLGKTVPDILNVMPESAQYFNKTRFSCCGASNFTQTVHQTHKRQAIVAGMETHICVMQSALELQDDGLDVFVADDAVCSQRMAHWKSALDRLRQAGITAAPTESILFEWLRDATHPQFKKISALMR